VTLEQILDKLKSLRGSMSTTQLVSLGVSFVGVMGAVIAFAFWLNQPTYRLLFSDMDAESAAAVTAARGQDVSTGSRTVGDRSRCRPTRSTSCASRSPDRPAAVGRLGFSVRPHAVRATEFLEERTARARRWCAHHRHHRRSLERARPHRDGQDSLFQSKEQPAKASVVLPQEPHAASLDCGRHQSLVAFAVRDRRAGRHSRHAGPPAHQRRHR
jgi:hypothetical protein